ncbi:MAG: hypothetical protein AAF558_00635 [Verrucomicrobiota bacterium]
MKVVLKSMGFAVWVSFLQMLYSTFFSTKFLIPKPDAQPMWSFDIGGIPTHFFWVPLIANLVFMFLSCFIYLFIYEQIEARQRTDPSL